jgi:epoxyqueuosine reductase
MKVEKESIRELAYDLGFDLVGFCRAEAPSGLPMYDVWLKAGYHGTMEYMQTSLDLRKDPANLLPNVCSIIAVGLNYYQPNDPRPGQPRIAKYALGRDYHKVLRKKLKKLAEWLANSYPEADFRPCVDSAPVFEREYAQRAGLGWYGKNTCLINTHRGSWFFLGLLLTSLEIDPDPTSHGRCGNCRICIEACPTGAIVYREGRWVVDARRCISYLTIEHKGEIEPELASQIEDWTFGCDICQDVCPFNRPREHQPLRSRITKESDFVNQYRWPSLVELAEISHEEWDRLTQGSPVRRAGWQGIRRNAKINLQNLKKKQ